MAGADFSGIQDAELENLRRLTEEANEKAPIVDTAMVQDLIALKRRKDVLADELKLVNKKLDAIQQNVIQQLLASGTKSVRTSENVLISLVTKYEYSASDEDKRSFALEYSRSDLLTINSSKFSSVIRKMNDGGERIPAYVKGYERKSLSVRGT